MSMMPIPQITGIANANKQIRELMKMLRPFGEKTEKRIAKKTLKNAVQRVYEQAGESLPERYGALKRSLATRPKWKGHSIAYDYGVREKYKEANPEHKGDSEKGRYLIPSKYVHLVIRGTVHSAPNPKFKNIFDSNKELIVSSVMHDLNFYIQKEIRKEQQKLMRFEKWQAKQDMKNIRSAIRAAKSITKKGSIV